MKLVSSLGEGYKHSPGDAEQGESYHLHLKEVIVLYAKLINSAEGPAPNISKENYEMQDRIVGIGSPIGTSIAASARVSTRGANQKAGLQLVQRVKESSAYSDEIDSNAVSNEMKSPKRKKSKLDVRDLIKKSN